MALGLLARHPDRPALTGTPALESKAAPLQVRQRATHGGTLGVAHGAPAIRQCDDAIDLSGKVEGREATTPAQEVHHGSLHPSETALISVTIL